MYVRACVSTCILGDVFEHALVYCRAQYWGKAAAASFFLGINAWKSTFRVELFIRLSQARPRTKKSIFLHVDLGEPSGFCMEGKISMRKVLVGSFPLFYWISWEEMRPNCAIKYINIHYNGHAIVNILRTIFMCAISLSLHGNRFSA